MKRKVTSLSRFAGIFLGITLAFCMAVFALTSVIVNEDFWLKQNDKYNHQETLNLVSSDDYSVLYHNYIEMLKGNKKDFTVTEKGKPQDYEKTFTEMGSIFSGKNPSSFKNSVTLSDKYFETVKALTKEKYLNENLDNRVFIEFSCPFANADFEGVNLSNLKISDSENKELEFSLKKISVLKDGSIKSENVENTENILFSPKSKSTKLRAYLNKGDVKDITVEFSMASLSGSAGVKVMYSYEETLTNDAVAQKIGPEVNLVTEEEKVQLLRASKINNVLKIIAGVLFVISVILCIYTVKKETRISLFGIGLYTVIISVILLVLINLLSIYVPSEWGFNQVFNFSENSASSLLMGQGFKNDFAKGAVRFFDFTMIAPIFIGYLLTKISKKKHYDPNEDYLYQ